MTRVHRMIAARLAPQGEGRGTGQSAGRGAGRRNGRAHRLKAAIIDTPYGFQSNADALSTTLLEYFRDRIGLSASVATLRRSDTDVLARETAYRRIREAVFTFSGPGSPSYALRHWAGTEIPNLFADKLARGGALVLASAAALCVGRLAVPVYEIYKAGEEPCWLPALDVLSTVGISAAVIPHYDNAEGAGHDTRFCFLGARRLEVLEEQLPADVYILGIDEHTCVLLDLDAERASVHGRGVLTIRERGATTTIPAGEEIPLADLRRPAAADTGALRPAGMPTRAAREKAAEAGPGDGSALAQRVLALEARAAEAADRERLVEPLIEELLELRRNARQNGDFDTADRIRARLTALGVELSDSEGGTTSYSLRPFR